MTTRAEIAPTNNVAQLIRFIRNQRVILDSDLAELSILGGIFEYYALGDV